MLPCIYRPQKDAGKFAFAPKCSRQKRPARAKSAPTAPIGRGGRPDIRAQVAPSAAMSRPKRAQSAPRAHPERPERGQVAARSRPGRGQSAPRSRRFLAALWPRPGRDLGATWGRSARPGGECRGVLRARGGRGANFEHVQNFSFMGAFWGARGSLAASSANHRGVLREWIGVLGDLAATWGQTGTPIKSRRTPRTRRCRVTGVLNNFQFYVI